MKNVTIVVAMMIMMMMMLMVKMMIIKRMRMLMGLLRMLMLMMMMRNLIMMYYDDDQDLDYKEDADRMILLMLLMLMIMKVFRAGHFRTTKITSFSDFETASCHFCMRTRSRFLRRLRSDLTRSLLILKNELGPTQNVLRTGSDGFLTKLRLRAAAAG